jgi:hypothetical protein
MVMLVSVKLNLARSYSIFFVFSFHSADYFLMQCNGA